jgi:hypothetical protein
MNVIDAAPHPIAMNERSRSAYSRRFDVQL